MKYLIWIFGVVLSGLCGYAFAELLGWAGVTLAIPVAIWMAGGNAMFGLMMEGK